MIAITFALPSESSDFRHLLGEPHPGVAILHTGVGEKICRQRLEPFLDSQSFDFLLSSGFAGGVDPSLGVADLLLAENFSDPALLARARELLNPAPVCNLPPSRAPAGPPRPSVAPRVAKLATVDRILQSPAEREQFARQHEAAAVDMETKWIARACAVRKIPMLSLRVISDTAAAPFPAPPEVLFDLTRQRTNASALARYLIIHPFAVVRLIRFSRQIATVRRELGLALRLIKDTPGPND